MILEANAFARQSAATRMRGSLPGEFGNALLPLLIKRVRLESWHSRAREAKKTSSEAAA
jgi:hypothetical protein